MLGDRFDAVLAAAVAGDGDAFAQLWRDAQPMLLRYLRVTASGSAEDVASQTWVRVIESLEAFRGTEPQFRRWLVTIARNLHVDEVRRGARQPVTPVEEPGELESRLAPDAAEEALERLSTEAALAVVSQLPETQAELVMLRVVMGLEVADVAAIVGKKPGAVRVAVHRSLKNLETLLDRGVAPAVTQTDPSSSSERYD